MLENPFDPYEKKDRENLRPVIGGILAAALVILVVLFMSESKADPVYQGNDGKVSVELRDDPCTLFTEVVVNMPYRAVWTEGGKTFEGCWALTNFGVVVAYFSDKTVAVMPVDFFQRVHGA